MSRSAPSAPLSLPAVVAVALAGTAAALLRPPNADLGWFLHMAGGVLDGARPYVDFVDPNPPLVLLLNFPAVLLARGLGTPIGPTYTAWIAVVCAACLALALRVLRRVGSPPATETLLPIVLAFAVFVLPRADFGQREHLAVALVLPFLLLFGARSAPVSRGLALAVGLAAGVGFSLKPFFLIPWLLVEIEARLVRRVGSRTDRNIASVAVVGVLAGYAGAVLALTPAYLSALRTLVVPSYPYYYPVPVGVLIVQLPVLAALGAIVLFIAVGWWVDEPLGRVIGLASLGFLDSLLLQRKGYSYHFYPPLALTAVMLPLLLGRFRGYGGVLLPRVLGAARHLVAAALILACAAVLVSAQASRRAFRAGPYARLRAVYATYAKDRPVLALGRGTEAGFPMVAQAGARWALPVPMIWPAVSRAVWRAGRKDSAAPEPPGLRAAERYVRDAVDRALAARPAVVVVDRAPIVTADGVADPDFARFFAGDAALRLVRDEYIDLGRIGTYDVYVLPGTCLELCERVEDASGTATVRPASKGKGS